MSQIKLLYGEYIKTVTTYDPNKQRAMDMAAEIIPQNEFLKIEEDITIAEDRMTEDAFVAGFKSAMKLIKEAIS